MLPTGYKFVDFFSPRLKKSTIFAADRLSGIQFYFNKQ
jgi:hypothetical protein